MKKLVTLILLATATLTFAQNQWAVGLVSSHFHNNSNSMRFNEIDNPFSYGLYVGTRLNETVTVGLTGMYINDDMQTKDGTESGFRTQMALFFTPVQFGNFAPYLSTGLVYSHYKQDFDGNTDTEDTINVRYAVGLDYMLTRQISLNAEMGFYSDIADYLGNVNSVGLRYHF